MSAKAPRARCKTLAKAPARRQVRSAKGPVRPWDRLAKARTKAFRALAKEPSRALREPVRAPVRQPVRAPVRQPRASPKGRPVAVVRHRAGKAVNDGFSADQIFARPENDGKDEDEPRRQGPSARPAQRPARLGKIRQVPLRTECCRGGNCR